MEKPRQMTLIIGATGSFGGALLNDILERGGSVRALVRDVDAAREQLGSSDTLELVAGDALVADDVRRAATGCDRIVYGFNVSYEDWDPVVLDACRIVCEVAAEEQALVLFPGNVYGLGPDFDEPLAEDASRQSPTRKGELRNQMEVMLADATESGARVIVVRCGDFFGPTGGGWFEQVLARPESGPIRYPGPTDVVHEWAFLPDVAEVTLRLANRAHELPAYSEFHFAGHQVDGEALADAIRTALDDPDRPMKPFRWWMVRLASPFVALLSELLEMRYLWDEPVRLDGGKLADFLGGYELTPLPVAISQTLEPTRSD